MPYPGQLPSCLDLRHQLEEMFPSVSFVQPGWTAGGPVLRDCPHPDEAACSWIVFLRGGPGDGGLSPWWIPHYYGLGPPPACVSHSVSHPNWQLVEKMEWMVYYL